MKSYPKEWRTPGGHPRASIVRAYDERFAACVRAGFGDADANEQAGLEAARVAKAAGLPEVER